MFPAIQMIVGNIATLILIVPLMPLVLIGFLIVLPVYIIPFLVSKCGPFLANSSTVPPNHLQSPRSTFDLYNINNNMKDPNGRKPHSSFSYSVVTGELNVEVVKDKLEQVLELRNTRGELKYPGMKQVGKEWIGFSFLELCKNFDISNHVKLFNGFDDESIDETRLAELICSVRKTDNIFSDEDKPSWEVLIINNFTPDPVTLPKNIKKSVERKYSVLLFHCGNGIMYGHHWDKIFVDLCDEKNGNINEKEELLETGRRVYEPSFVDGIWSYAKFPFNLVKKTLTGDGRKGSKGRKVRYLHSLLNAEENESDHEFLIVFGKLYDSEYFQGIGESLHVNIQSVLLAAILGGLRRFIDYSYLHTHRDFHDFFKVRVPITLGNGFELLNALDLPLAEPDPLVRLQIIDKNVQILKEEAKEICPYTKSKPFGSLLSEKTEKVSAVVSSTITSEVQLKLQGNVVIDRMSENFLDEDASIVFNMTKYAGRVRLNLIVDKSLIPYEDDGKILFGYVDKELQVLESLAGF